MRQARETIDAALTAVVVKMQGIGSAGAVASRHYDELSTLAGCIASMRTDNSTVSEWADMVDRATHLRIEALPLIDREIAKFNLEHRRAQGGLRRYRENVEAARTALASAATSPAARLRFEEQLNRLLTGHVQEDVRAVASVAAETQLSAITRVSLRAYRAATAQLSTWRRDIEAWQDSMARAVRRRARASLPAEAMAAAANAAAAADAEGGDDEDESAVNQLSRIEIVAPVV